MERLRYYNQQCEAVIASSNQENARELIETILRELGGRFPDLQGGEYEYYNPIYMPGMKPINWIEKLERLRGRIVTEIQRLGQGQG